MKKITSAFFQIGALTASMFLLGSEAVGADDNSPLDVSVGVSVKVTDNRDQIEDGYTIGNKTYNKESDTEMAAYADIKYSRRIDGLYRFNVVYHPAYTFFDNPREGSEESSWSHSFLTKLEYYAGQRTYLSLFDKFWWSGEKDWYYGSDNDIVTVGDTDRNDDYYENTFSGHLQYNFTEKNYLAVDGSWRIKRYDDSELAKVNDEDELNLRVALMRRPTRFYALGLFADYTSFDRESITDFDLGVDYVTLGVQLLYDVFGDETVVINASTGYNIMQYEDDNMDDNDMFGDTRLSVSLFPHERTRGSFGMRYGNTYASVYPYSSEQNTVFFGNISQLFGANNRYKIGADVEYRMREYSMEDLDSDVLEDPAYKARLEDIAHKGDRGRDSLWLRLYFDTEWTSSVKSSIFYTYEDMDSEVDKSYKENVFGVRLSFKFM